MKPEYSIGQVSKQFGLPVSTLRYYDREGLFPGLERSGGIDGSAPRSWSGCGSSNA